MNTERDGRNKASNLLQNLTGLIRFCFPCEVVRRKDVIHNSINPMWIRMIAHTHTQLAFDSWEVKVLPRFHETLRLQWNCIPKKIQMFWICSRISTRRSSFCATHICSFKINGFLGEKWTHFRWIRHQLQFLSANHLFETLCENY